MVLADVPVCVYAPLFAIDITPDILPPVVTFKAELVKAKVPVELPRVTADETPDPPVKAPVLLRVLKAPDPGVVAPIVVKFPAAAVVVPIAVFCSERKLARPVLSIL